MTGKYFRWRFKNYWEAIGMLKRGEPIFCTQQLKDGIYRFSKDLTFLEIYEQNKWNLNITVTDGIR